MNEKFTPDSLGATPHAEREESSQKKLLPGKKTLDFIRQFAYAYHVEKQLPEPISGLLLN